VGSSSSSSGGGPPGQGDAEGGGFAVIDASDDATPCAATTLTGKVFDPAGQNPIEGAVVFVPTTPVNLPAITPGANSCGSCGASIGSYVTATVTDPTGTFMLQGVPSGTSVPVVVEIGKWRRLTYVSVGDECGPNTVADGVLRLPRERSEGDLPQMAVLTGGADDLGCFLRGMGLDPSEYGPPQSGGRLDVYQGSGGPGLTTGTAGACSDASPVCPLWASKSALEYYDIVLLACEGSTNAGAKPAASLQFMHDWLSEGGKVFATHFQYYWFQSGPADFQEVATWTGFSAGIGSGNYAVDTSFLAGEDFDQWLKSPDVEAAAGTTIALDGVADSVSAVSQNATRWIYDPSTGNPKYLSFLTPIGGARTPDGGLSEGEPYCGKAVFTDLHTSGAPSGMLPTACATTLTAQQKALEYLFFSLSQCVSAGNPLPQLSGP
jgi:hypothetical protein